MKPSATASVPQRARRSAVEWTPPKLVASATSSSAGEEALRALGAVEREADERAERLHLAHGDRVVRVVGEAGVADVEHLRPLAQPEREGQRVRALALEPQGERGERAVQHPGLERACDRAALRAVRAQPRGPLGSRTETAPRTRSEWPDSALVALSIAASAPRSSGRWPSGVASVLSTASRPPAAWTALGDGGDVGDVERRVRGRLDPRQRRALAGGHDRLGVGGDEPHLDPARREPVAGDRAHPRVPVLHDDEDVAGAERGLEHRADRGHPGTRTAPTRRRRAPRCASSTAVQVGFPSRP